MMSGISGMGGMMGGMRPDPQQIFNRVDKDGNGGLDESELGAMADKIAERTGKEIDVDSLMEEYDGDGDGVLNQDETQTAMESLKEKMGPPIQHGGINGRAG
jgi:Ca2+-binding EF-hand superfamily protein